MEDDHQITPEANIMQELTTFYSQLFAKEGKPAENKARVETQLLHYTKHTISDCYIQRLACNPSKYELCKTIKLTVK